MRRHWISFASCALALSACDPYTRFVGQSTAGPVDPRNFPAAYLGKNTDGSAANGKTPGSAQLLATPAFTAGVSTPYYSFPFTGNDIGLGLGLDFDGQLEAPLAYDFDEDGTTHCVAPDNYVYDQQTDDVRYNEQGDVFTQLPDADGYQPVVADVIVHSNGLHCQDTKQDTDIVQRNDVLLTLVPAANPNEPDSHATGKPSGVYYARPIVDPSVDIHFPDGSLDPNTGLGPQRWGWYQRYLLAFLDGGKIPTLAKDVPNSSGGVQHVIEMVTQPIYFPTQQPGDDGQGNIVPVAGSLGSGHDVLTATLAKPADPAFSPLCQVFSFVPANPLSPEKKVADINMATAQPTGDYVWCIQIDPTVAP